MRRVRIALCWFFAFDSLSSFQTACQDILRIVHKQEVAHPFICLPGATVFSLAGIVSVLAWWTVWRQKASGRGWALAASVWSLFLGGPFFYLWFHGWGGYWQLLKGWLWLPMVVGVLGLVAFLRPYEPPQLVA
jgi:hypothetical protein